MYLICWFSLFQKIGNLTLSCNISTLPRIPALAFPDKTRHFFSFSTKTHFSGFRATQNVGRTRAKGGWLKSFVSVLPTSQEVLWRLLISFSYNARVYLKKNNLTHQRITRYYAHSFSQIVNSKGRYDQTFQ